MLKQLLTRLSKVTLALVLGLLLCELVLQVLHLGLGVEQRGGAGGAELLCIGDSHTFGWNVDAAGTWPARLEAQLAQAGIDWHVANRGAPGKNTETLLGELDEYLALDHPRVVLILAGLNNPWSRPHRGSGSWLAAHSRTARLVQLLVARVRGDGRIQGAGQVGGTGSFDETELATGRKEVRVVTREGNLEAFQIGGGTMSYSETQATFDWIERDLIELAERVVHFGAHPVLLTYAQEEGEYIPNVNFAIREAAANGGIDLIDVAAVFTPELDRFGRERLFFPDAHPRREGYGVVARVVFDGLVELGLLPAEPLGQPFEELAGGAPEPQLAVLSGNGSAGLELELRYEPELSYSLLFASSLASPDTEQDWYGVQVGLQRDAVFEASAEAEALRGSFGDGRAQLELSSAELEALGAGEGALYAVLVARTGDWTVLAASPPLRIR